MNIVFFGSSAYVIPIIEVLQKNFHLSLVLTTEELSDDPVSSYCTKSKVCCYVAVNFRKDRKILQMLKNTHATLGILASFSAIIPNEILQIFPKGILNIHPSLLPKYRGPTPVQTAILNGEKETGVSIIKLDDKVDHGPILGLQKEEILDNDTSESLYERLFEKGANLLLKLLNSYLKGNLKPSAQNHKEATFTKPLTRQDGYLSLSNTKTAVIKIDRMIRAYFPWPGVWTRIRIKNSHFAKALKDEQELRIKFLPEKKLQVEGKKPISYQDFLNGYPDAKTLIERIFDVRDS